MSRSLVKQYGGNEVLVDPVHGIVYAWGTTVPSDAAVGYAPGCTFVDVNASGAAAKYTNVGTKASANFDLDGGGLNLSTLVATAAELNRAADVSTRIVNCTAATLTVTELEHDGKTIVLDRAAGIEATLPSASAGLHFHFIVKTTFTSAATIKSVVGTDIMIGMALMGNDSTNSVVDWPAVAADTFDTINLLGTANSTGGMAGQEIHIRGLAAAVWHVTIRGDAAGTEATPFENTVT